MKICFKCNLEKAIEEFPVHNQMKDGHLNKCKSCQSIDSKNHYKKNRGKLLTKALQYQEENKEQRSNYKKEWYKKNREHILKKREDYYEENKNEVKARSSFYSKNNRDRVNASARKRNSKRRKTDINFKIRENLRNRLKMAIKNGAKGGSAVRDLGCSIEYFKKYIAEKFQEGMSWDNWGYNTWHLDHKIPLATFDLTDRAQFLKACHYTNLQPMWGPDNIRKGASIENPTQEIIPE